CGHEATNLHNLSHAARPNRPRARRQVDQHRAHAGTGEGPDAIILAHKIAQLQTTLSSPIAMATSLTFTAISSRDAIRDSIGRSRSMGAIRKLIGMVCCRLMRRPTF